MQIARMNASKSSTKALKQRTDLLLSYDILTSHLNTTFTALSSALARGSGTKAASENRPDAVPLRARVYLGIFVGSNAASAKSKVLFAVDGLELKSIGSRDDQAARQKEGEDEDSEGEGEEEEDGVSVDGEGDDGEDASEESEDEEDGEISDDEGEDDTDDEADTDPTSPPPESRSPSPEAPSYPSYAEEQRALQAAERLLSRTLARADAEGHGMSADMAPTQTHILLRAPRRFVHPAWVPRQNISSLLESTLNEFLEESGIKPSDGDEGVPMQKRQSKGKKVEGVWVTCRGGLNTLAGKNEVSTGAVEDDEWDEMIWWSWDGKIVGFSEW
ncbi:hypothetical protein H0H81_002824 [Sphagnurus paluster]|uniref:Uncharacterized protein n=1 Tax=Sphagnurus paluster TaxID=117069 RepID=A0A9P7KHD4_9AGAR|nr:hypothetical protein H0H81_002824 [Sphagnurus paluster]